MYTAPKSHPTCIEVLGTTIAACSTPNPNHAQIALNFRAQQSDLFGTAPEPHQHYTKWQGNASTTDEARCPTCTTHLPGSPDVCTGGARTVHLMRNRIETAPMPCTYDTTYTNVHRSRNRIAQLDRARTKHCMSNRSKPAPQIDMDVFCVGSALKPVNVSEPRPYEHNRRPGMS